MNKKLKLEELNRLDIAAFRRLSKNPIVIVLDNIRSAQNIGSIFRTADAMAIDSIVLCGITATPPHREIYKTALGATDAVNWSYESKTIDAVVNLREEGYSIIALEQVQNSVKLNDFNPNYKKMALVVGNEVEGVSQPIINLADFCIEIPQFGTKHSLNVSVSTGIALWDLVSKIKKA